MNTLNISPDDPRLTAYALGELEAAERAEVEALLQNSPSAQAAVEEIRGTVAQLEAALSEEPLPAVTPTKEYYRKKPGKLLSFPKLYFAVGTLAAACFAVVVVLREPRPKPLETEKGDFARALPAENDGTTVATANAPELAMIQAQIAQKEAELRQMLGASRSAVAREKNPAREKQVRMTAQAGAVAAPAPIETVSTAAVTLGIEAEIVPVQVSTENYAHTPETGFVRVADQPLSTFSAEVDTASYANVRRFLNEGRLPPKDAVRIEELVNYFPYHYAAPTNDVPFGVTLEVAGAPWAPEHRLVRIGLKGREVATAARPAANLVFLLDVSGSMDAPNKLPLVKAAMRLLVERLRPDDRVAIVTYAGNAGLALPSTMARKAAAILAAVDALQPAGSTHGAMGIQLAYDIAKANFISAGINRVVLCTDGDFNVGVSDEGGLVRLIEEKAKGGVFLSVLGFGMGNYQDAKLELLAAKGNGNYGYIDTQREAEKLLVEQINGTLVTIAKDVKLQVEFNPTQVASYRLIGYENRRLQKEDFNNDKVDAGEIGAGHTVTALYEIMPAQNGAQVGEDGLKYQRVTSVATGSRELLTVKLRYKAPDGAASRLVEFPLLDHGAAFATATADFKFTAGVAGFGMLLRESEYKGASSWAEVQAWAEAGKGDDVGGYRHEFLSLLSKARQLAE